MFSTTGLSWATGQLNAFGRLVIIALMFGMAGVVTIVLILLKRRGRESLAKYPEEMVLVG